MVPVFVNNSFAFFRMDHTRSVHQIIIDQEIRGILQKGKVISKLNSPNFDTVTATELLLNKGKHCEYLKKLPLTAEENVVD